MKILNIIGKDRIQLIKALFLVIVYYLYFFNVYDAWNMAGGLNMPEAGLSILTYLLMIPIFVTLGLSILIPNKVILGFSLGTLMTLSVSCFQISWITMPAATIVLDLMNKKSLKIMPKRMKTIDGVLLWIGLLLSLIIVVGAVKLNLSYTDAINRLGTEPIHQAQSFFVLMMTDFSLIASVMFLLYRNRITIVFSLLASMILAVRFLPMLQVTLGWIIILIIVFQKKNNVLIKIV